MYFFSLQSFKIVLFSVGKLRNLSWLLNICLLLSWKLLQIGRLWVLDAFGLFFVKSSSWILWSIKMHLYFFRSFFATQLLLIDSIFTSEIYSSFCFFLHLLSSWLDLHFDPKFQAKFPSHLFYFRYKVGYIKTN